MVNPTNIECAQKIFSKHGGMLRTSEAIRLGLHPRTLYALKDEGVLVTVSRGLYRLAVLEALTEPDLVTVAVRVPQAVVCLISALAFHDLTSEIPHEVQIALPRNVKAPRLDHPPLRVFRFSGDSFSAGVEEHKMDGIKIKIYGPEKTVADCFKFRNKVGIEVAIEALKLCLKQKRSRPRDILKYARICGVERIMRPYLESLL